MDMSADEQSIALAALDNVWKQPRRCPVCQSNAWVLSPNFFELREYRGGDLYLAGVQIIPAIAVTCVTCGYTLLFNAIRLGLKLPTATSRGVGPAEPSPPVPVVGSGADK